MAFNQDQQLSIRMRPHIQAVYDQHFPGATYHPFDGAREGSVQRLLDRQMGIDGVLLLPCGAPVYVQEKVQSERPPQYDFMFCVEHKNAYGTEHESPGEWFKLAAQLYFLGEANADQTGFKRWLLLDVLKFKLWVEQHGGLEQVKDGPLRVNQAYGKASFYAIPAHTLTDSILHHEGFGVQQTMAV